MKKILVSMLTLAAVLVVLPMFAAFEAHVINVTATIENALSVPVTPIEFGTVFPQEELNKTLDINLSGSFLTEGRVDDVEYIIRQKPKCAVTSEDGTQIIGDTWTGHVIPDNSEQGYRVDCDTDKPDEVITDNYAVLPSLCQYISKHPDGKDITASLDNPNGNDGSLNSFHQPWTVVVNGNNPDTVVVEIDWTGIVWTDVKGRLAKSQQDETDTWTIDLAVPCFGGYCAQDWASFVESVNPGASPDEFVQDKNNEHKVFGCDLWVEVTGVSEDTTPDDDGESTPT